MTRPTRRSCISTRPWATGRSPEASASCERSEPSPCGPSEAVRADSRSCRGPGTPARTLKTMRIAPAPPTPREEVVDAVHGERIVDPYRWLEDDGSARVRAWTEAQNARTRAVLDALPQRRHFAFRLPALLSVGLLSAPHPVAGRIFHTRRAGEEPQAVLYVRDGPTTSDRALVDPNALDGSGLVTLDWYYPSSDGRYVAYGLSLGGDEMSTLHVIEVASGR